MDEKSYRKENRESYSSVKAFDTDRIKYYKKFILNDKSEEDEMSTSMILGSLIDCKLFSPSEFDNKFHTATCTPPSGQMLDFTNELCLLTKKCLNKDLIVTRDIQELLEEAFNNVKYDGKKQEVKFKGKDMKWLIANFVGSDAETYYKECRSIFSKIVVDLNIISASEKIIDELQTCEWTKDIINAKTEGDVEVIDQLGVFFDVEEEPFKAMPDRILISHKNKTITPYDMKISFSGENFQYNYWKMKYYLQVASYYLAIREWQKTRKDLEGYLILSIEFIVGSSTLQSNPLLYSTSPTNVNEGLYGFTTRNGVKYKGLYELVEDINWHKKHQLWRNSREVYENKGKMIIRPFEED